MSERVSGWLRPATHNTCELRFTSSPTAPSLLSLQYLSVATPAAAAALYLCLLNVPDRLPVGSLFIMFCCADGMPICIESNHTNGIIVLHLCECESERDTTVASNSLDHHASQLWSRQYPMKRASTLLASLPMSKSVMGCASRSTVQQWPSSRSKPTRHASTPLPTHALIKEPHCTVCRATVNQHRPMDCS
jgi:hypothetical protein